jgi:hypothetical protein
MLLLGSLVVQLIIGHVINKQILHTLLEQSVYIMLNACATLKFHMGIKSESMFC